jgi:hypothetical protein
MAEPAIPIVAEIVNRPAGQPVGNPERPLKAGEN